MQPKTRKFPLGNLPKIASTACVPSQAPFPQVPAIQKLEKIGLQWAYPPDPLMLPKSVIAKPEFLILVHKNTHRRKRHITKSSILNMERMKQWHKENDKTN